MSCNNKKIKITDIAFIGVFAAVMAICSWISVPFVVPFTLQTFGVFLTIGVLGGKRGTMSILVYLLLGALGVPVFSGFSGGIGYMLGSTGGYIIGFLFSALVMWLIECFAPKTKLILIIQMLAGLLVCYAFGTAWFMIVYTKNIGAIGLWTALIKCVIPYIIPDLIKIAVASLICKRIAKACKLD